MILDDMSDLFEEATARKTAKEIARDFNRNRKWVYQNKNCTYFKVDIDFICGLSSLGYELKLVKKGERKRR